MNYQKRLLVTVVARNKGKMIAELIAANEIRNSMIILGQGTATSEIMSLFGFDKIEKDVVLSLADSSKINDIFTSYKENMLFSLRGDGISFSLPLSSISIAGMLLSGESKFLENTEVKPMDENFAIIVAYIENGMSELAMNAARSAGAQGGTVIKARDISVPEENVLTGLPVGGEKSILFILAEKSISSEIMKNICAEMLEQTKERCICFSLPTNDVLFSEHK